MINGLILTKKLGRKQEEHNKFREENRKNHTFLWGHRNTRLCLVYHPK